MQFHFRETLAAGISAGVIPRDLGGNKHPLIKRSSRCEMSSWHGGGSSTAGSH